MARKRVIVKKLPIVETLGEGTQLVGFLQIGLHGPFSAVMIPPGCFLSLRVGGDDFSFL